MKKYLWNSEEYTNDLKSNLQVSGRPTVGTVQHELSQVFFIIIYFTSNVHAVPNSNDQNFSGCLAFRLKSSHLSWYGIYTYCCERLLIQNIKIYNLHHDENIFCLLTLFKQVFLLLIGDFVQRELSGLTNIYYFKSCNMYHQTRHGRL